MTVKRTAHAQYELWYHIAWSTKYRKEIFTQKRTSQRVKEILRAIAYHYDMDIQEIEVCPDHLHILIQAPPRLAPARMVQILKSVSTKKLFAEFPWLRNEYWGGEVWVQGYFVRSVGQHLTKETIKKYIQNQGKPKEYK